MHYSRWQKHGDPLGSLVRRLQVVFRKQCDQCGEGYTLDARYAVKQRERARFCSIRCGNAWRAQQQAPGLRRQARWSAAWERHRYQEELDERDRWALPAGPKPEPGLHCRLSQQPEPRKFIGSICLGCGESWVQYAARDDGVYCARCNKRRWRHDCNHRRRLRLAAAVCEVISADEVFKRDGYRCQLCGKKTRGQFPGPRSPTLDHIIPLAKGGEHSYKNVQCACFTCNSRKGMQSANDQLRLVG